MDGHNGDGIETHKIFFCSQSTAALICVHMCVIFTPEITPVESSRG